MQKITMRHRLLSVLLCAVLLLSTFVTTAAVSVSAAEAEITEISAEVEAADEAADVDAAEEAAAIEAAEEAAALELVETGDDPCTFDASPFYEDEYIKAYRTNSTGKYYRQWSVNSGTGVFTATGITKQSTYFYMYFEAKKDGYLDFDFSITCGEDTWSSNTLYYKTNMALGGSRLVSDSISSSYPKCDNYDTAHGRDDFRGNISSRAFPTVEVKAGDRLGLYYSKQTDYTDPATISNVRITTPAELEAGGISKDTVTFHIQGGDGGHMALTSGGASIASVDVYEGYPVSVYAVPEDGNTNAYFYTTSDYDAAHYIAYDRSNPLKHTFTYTGTDSDIYVRFVGSDAVDGYIPVDGGETADYKIETLPLFGWTYDTVGSTTVLASGAQKVKNQYSYLKVTAKNDGVFSFDYKLDMFETDSINLIGDYGVFLYKNGAAPTYARTFDGDNYLFTPVETLNYHSVSNYSACVNEIELTPSYSLNDILRESGQYYYGTIEAFSGQVDWKTVGIRMTAGQSLYLAFYNKELSGSDSSSNSAYIKGMSFDSSKTEHTITFNNDSAKGWIASSDRADAAQVASVSGYESTSAGRFFAIPKIKDGYQFEGLYTTSDFQEGTMVEPVDGMSRTYELIFGDTDITYYPKFTKKQGLTYTIPYSALQWAMTGAKEYEGQHYIDGSVGQNLVTVQKRGSTSCKSVYLPIASLHNTLEGTPSQPLFYGSDAIVGSTAPVTGNPSKSVTLTFYPGDAVKFKYEWKDGYYDLGSYLTDSSGQLYKHIALNANDVIYTDDMYTKDPDTGEIHQLGDNMKLAFAMVRLKTGSSSTMGYDPLTTVTLSEGTRQVGYKVHTGADYYINDGFNSKGMTAGFTDIGYGGQAVEQPITMYSWKKTVDSGDPADEIYQSGNAGEDYSYSYLRIGAQATSASKGGILFFDCKMEAPNGAYLLMKTYDDSYANNLAYADNAQIKSNARAVWDNVNFNIAPIYDLRNYSAERYSSFDWETFQVNTFLNINEKAVKLAYYRGDAGYSDNDCVWVKNIRVVPNVAQTVTLQSNNNAYGTADFDTATTTGKPGETVRVTATPAANCVFIGWYDPQAKEIVSTSATFDYKITWRNPTLQAMFAPELEEGAEVVASIGSAQFESLDDAMSFAKSGNTVILEKTYEQKNDLTIPAGVTLLVPFDAENTMYTDVSEETDGLGTSHSLYRKLTVADGKTITVNGSISLSAKHPTTTTSTNHCGAVTGPYSQIELGSGSKMILNNGSNLYAWGLITGAGSITAENGSNIFEMMQVNDWRGGSLTSGMYLDDINQFPFNQYYVQNIETQLTYKYGCRETVLIDITAGGSSNKGKTEFIGPNGLFRISDSDSLIERWYDPEADQMQYDITGNAMMSDITVRVLGIGLNTKSFYLPINNIVVSVRPIDDETPGVFEVNNKIVFLPGSSIKVDKGATLNIAKGALVMADKDIGKYSAANSYPCKPVVFSPTRTGTRTWADTKAASLNNNGTVIVADGAALASTSADANIYSGDGLLIINGSNAFDRPIQRITTSGTDITQTDEIDLIPIILHNVSADNIDTGASADSWCDGAGNIYSAQEIDGEVVYNDYREVTYYDVDGATQLGAPQTVSISDKNNIHSYDDDVTAHAGFKADGSYVKYGENGSWNYSVNPSDPTKLTATPVLEEESIFEKHSLTLEGYIDANFFLFDVPAGATVSYSWGEDADNGDAPFTATDTTFTNQDGYKKTSVSLAAKEINDDITVNLIYNNNVVASETYKASDYLYTVIGMNKSDLAAEIGKTQAKAAQLQTLCKATLDYCAKAQIQFGYHTDSLADSALSYSYDQVDTDGLSSYSIEGDSYDDLSYLSLSGQGYDYYGQSLTLESGTDYNIIFRNRTGMPLTATAVDAADDSVTYTVRRRVLNGAAVGTDGIGDYVTFDIRNIPAAKLSDDIVFTFAGGITVTVNPATYMHAAMYTADYYQAQYPVYAERLRNVVAALYNYNQVAVDYFAD